MGETAPTPIISIGRRLSSCTVDVDIQTGRIQRPRCPEAVPAPCLAALRAWAFSQTAGGAKKVRRPHGGESGRCDIDGTVALTYLKGRAIGGDGHRFTMLNDMRIMKGTYLAADGSQHFGTFAFT